MSEALRTVAEYVKRYAIKHGITPEEALDHVMVKMFKDYKEHENDDNNSKAENSIEG